MTGIENWLQKFKERWKQGDVDKVMELFSEDVEYHETPFQTLDSREEIREEWRAVRNQEDIELETEVFASDSGRHTVRYRLRYTENGQSRELRGIYLVKLGSEGRCEEFWQYFQTE